jgi:hypothetical protein
MLVPVFSEVTLFGITLKQQIRELSEQVSGIQNDIRNTIDIRNQFSPVLQIPLPPPDSSLPDIEQRLRKVLQDVLRNQGIDQAPAYQKFDIPDNVTYLFTARFEIEKELRRIWRQRAPQEEARRALPAFQVAQSLVSAGIIDPRVAIAIREVYSVASPAIHGQPVTKNQVDFVKDVAPQLLATLKAVE